MMSILRADARSATVHNLFFAALPAAEERARIRDLVGALRIGGVPLRLDRLHISIMALTVDDPGRPGQARKAAAIAASLRAAPFRVIFDRLVGGQRSAMLLPSEPLEALRGFRTRLADALTEAGIAVRRDGRFSPHVTLLYGGQPQPEIEIEPIGWTVREFVLIDSFVGETRHVELGRWPLCA